jgi:hypothetical protein
MSADLFTAAAEREALSSGRPLSQELAEIKGAPTIVPGIFTVEGPRFDLTFEPARLARQTCGTCAASFIAKPRTPATCNLCRAKVTVPDYKPKKSIC